MRSEGQSERRAELEAQRRALAAACTRRGWQLLEAVEEAGRSAKDRKRPGVEEALRVLECADAQALVAAKRDTLSQAMLDPQLCSWPRRSRPGRWLPSTAASRRRHRPGRHSRTCSLSSPNSSGS